MFLKFPLVTQCISELDGVTESEYWARLRPRYQEVFLCTFNVHIAKGAGQKKFPHANNGCMHIILRKKKFKGKNTFNSQNIQDYSQQQNPK